MYFSFRIDISVMIVFLHGTLVQRPEVKHFRFFFKKIDMKHELLYQCMWSFRYGYSSWKYHNFGIPFLSFSPYLPFDMCYYHFLVDDLWVWIYMIHIACEESFHKLCEYLLYFGVDCSSNRRECQEKKKEEYLKRPPQNKWQQFRNILIWMVYFRKTCGGHVFEV